MKSGAFTTECREKRRFSSVFSVPLWFSSRTNHPFKARRAVCHCRLVLQCDFEFGLHCWTSQAVPPISGTSRMVRTFMCGWRSHRRLPLWFPVYSNSHVPVVFCFRWFRVAESTRQASCDCVARTQESGPTVRWARQKTKAPFSK